MTGQKCNGTDLDGKDNWNNLKKRENGRPGLENAYFWMWMNYGSVRTDRWKLIYSESDQRAELYDLQNDIGETTDVSEHHPDVSDALIAMYKKWVEDNHFALSYMAVSENNISQVNPEPEGDLLEISATQPEVKDSPSRNGVFIRCCSAGEWEDDSGVQYIETGDRLE